MNVPELFRQAILAEGLTPPDAIVPDSQWHRFASNGDRDDHAGWYKLHADGIPAGAFGCFRLGITKKWRAKTTTALNATERRLLSERLRAIRQQRQEDQRRYHAEAAARAQTIWADAHPASDDHPYLLRKQVKAHGLRVDHENQLIIPVTIDQTLTSVEYIAPDGDGTKRYLRGGRKHGGSFTFGELCDAPIILLGEGFATVASLHESTGYPAVMAFDAGNLLVVAQQLRQQHPTATILMCGDNDIHADEKPNTGLPKRRKPRRRSKSPGHAGPR
jgi:putative DNA primase/helicase